MKAARIIAGIALAATAWALHARPVAPAAPAAPTPAEVVAARQAGMAMSAVTLNALRTAATNGVPVRNLAFPAGSLAKWAAAMPALFAPGTSGIASRARAEVWSDPAGFAARAAAYGDATRALAAAAAADDKDAFAAALASAGAACKGCHDSYQAPPPAARAG